MKQIPISQLIPGMVTAQNVLDYELNIIIPKGIILTENIISRLEGYSVFYVNIKDEMSDSFTSNISSEINSDSPEFVHFYENYKLLESQFSASVNASYFGGISLPYQNLVSEAIDLLYFEEKKISLFNVLLLMKHKEDSVFAHCIDVALICYELSGWLRFSDHDQIIACACGLFHDAGKLALPQHILKKPGKLTPAEFEVIKTHTTEGFHILQRIGNLPKHIVNAALMHHEKCDGTGYPYGLTRNEIDKFAKIVTIADVFDAMTSDRVYRKAMCPFDVIKHFEDQGLQKYEPDYLLTFLENVSNSYINHKVTLSNGLEGNVVFINSDSFSKPVVKTSENEFIDLQKNYYNNIMNLSEKKDISIETII